MPSLIPESPAFALLRQQLASRIMILDGATGTMIQQYKLTEAQYRGSDRAELSAEVLQSIQSATAKGIDVKGNNELLSLTRPEVISEIHHQYLAAGADIVETNTFGATTIAQEDYRLPELDESRVGALSPLSLRSVFDSRSTSICCGRHRANTANGFDFPGRKRSRGTQHQF
jgi:5-methyltetrahydrofolate--homocysteine methyltransferase